jgi:hypothetical protein
MHGRRLLAGGGVSAAERVLLANVRRAAADGHLLRYGNAQMYDRNLRT